MKSAIIALSCGKVLYGKSVGFHRDVFGEIVFNTSMMGYQEIMTDPSYSGQIITFTFPEIGIVGVNKEDMESNKVWAKAVVARRFSEFYTNLRANCNLRQFFIDHQVVAIDGIDTRLLVSCMRDQGFQSAYIMIGNIDEQVALSKALKYKQMILDQDSTLSSSWVQNIPFQVPKVEKNIVLIDCGVKKSIIEKLKDLNIDCCVMDCQFTLEKLFSIKPDGVVLSNGPGDPRLNKELIYKVVKIIEKKIPLFGICFGHQILALASGCEIEKMSLGHHGANHPVYDFEQQKVFISAQNHCYVVSDKNLPDYIKITHRSLFDNSIAGFKRLDCPVISFQGHPEASPGPMELGCLFKQFKNLMKS